MIKTFLAGLIKRVGEDETLARLQLWFDENHKLDQTEIMKYLLYQNETYTIPKKAFVRDRVVYAQSYLADCDCVVYADKDNERDCCTLDEWCELGCGDPDTVTFTVTGRETFF